MYNNITVIEHQDKSNKKYKINHIDYSNIINNTYKTVILIMICRIVKKRTEIDESTSESHIGYFGPILRITQGNFV